MKKNSFIVVLIIMSIGLICGIFVMKVDNRKIKKESTKYNNITVQEKVKNEKSKQEKINENLDKVYEEEIVSKESVSNQKIDTKVSIKNTSSNAKIEKEEYKTPSVQIEKSDIEIVKKTAWEELGICEYDYYNKPAHSWAKVDFSNLKTCQDYGNSYIAEQGGGYFCYSVNSYSGKYLGEDFDYYE